MYHSHLLINIGDNPDRPDWNIARKWLRNLYRVHQRLCMAFPSKVPVSRDERISAYCARFGSTALNYQRDLPGETDVADVHHERGDDAGFLFRIDHPVDHKRGFRRPVIIVQSANEPDWEFAFGLNENQLDDLGRPVGNAGYLLAAPPQKKEISISIDSNTLWLSSQNQNENRRITKGDFVRFRLRANPITKRDGKRHRLRISDDVFNDPDRKKRDEAFIKVHNEWLQNKFGDAATDLEVPIFVTGWSYGWRSKHEPQPSQRMQWWSVLFEGTFRVNDVSKLKQLLESGVGPAKAFGFGLLSIASVQT